MFMLFFIHWLKQTPFYQTQLHLYSIGAVLTLKLWVRTVALAAPRDLAGDYMPRNFAFAHSSPADFKSFSRCLWT